ncbi:MAG TPA: CBS domain-containing protein [Polyangia bacterium]|jgi:CBS domain-containing protein|nr:CBS domain-containing protein [Polyangia bacterium]
MENNNNKTMNRNGSDIDRFAGSGQGQQPGSAVTTGLNEQGSNGGDQSSSASNPDRTFRRLSRNPSSNREGGRDPSRDGDRNSFGRSYPRGTDRGFGAEGYGGAGYRDFPRDNFDEQRMDDEGGAQGYRRWAGDASDAQWQNDRYRSDDRSSSDRPYDRYGRNDGSLAPDFQRGGGRYQPRYDAYQQDDRRRDRGDRPRHERSRLSPKRWWQNEGATVADVMTKDVKTVGPDASIREVAEIMRKEDVGVVPIVGEDGRLFGLVTDRDIVVRGTAAGKALDGLHARDVATTDIEVASARDSLTDIIDLMGRQQIRRVPVVDDGDRLVGIVSLADIANRADQDEELQDAFEKISGRRSFWTRIWR